jgi:hypothetical protein
MIDADTGEIEVPHSEYIEDTGMHVSGSRVLFPGDEEYDYWLEQIKMRDTVEKFFTHPQVTTKNPQREKFVWRLEDLQRVDDRDREK